MTGENDLRNMRNRILVIDDNTDLLNILKRLLENSGIQADTADSGEGGLDLLRGCLKEYDLVLLDIQMPDMNGYEVLAHIRSDQRPEINSIPVIAMTGGAVREDVEGVDDILSKPFRSETLVPTLVQVLMKKNEKA